MRWLGLFLVVWSIGCTSTSKQHVADQAISAVFDRHELLGMSVVLTRGDSILYSKQQGQLRPGGPEMTANTFFRVASISKTFTVIGILDLVMKGKLHLDSAASTYLPWELQHPRHPEVPITLRLLCSHLSGIRDGEGYGSFLAQPANTQNISELFTEGGAYYTQDMFGDQAPGSYFSYSNAAMGILASIIEHTTLLRFDVYMRRHVLTPMGIQGSFNVSDIPSGRLATLYRFKNNDWVPQADAYGLAAPPDTTGYQLGANGLLFGPQGGFRGNTTDLVKLIQFFRRKGAPLLSEELYAEMVTPMWNVDGENGDTWEDFWRSYGLGIHRLTGTTGKDMIFEDIPMIGHPGIAYGLLSDCYYAPSMDVGIIFVTNGSKNAFSYAEQSSFYQLEHDIFKELQALTQ